MKAYVLALLVVFAFSACSDEDGGEGAPADPRCESLCTIKEPELEGAYDICSEASAMQCLRDCAARISDVSSVCASCLLEQACFDTECGPHKEPGGSDCDSSGQLVEVQSTVGGRAHFRVEPCADSAAPRFVLTRDQAEGPVAAAAADLPAGRYFVVAGSDGPTFSPSELLRVKLY